MLAVRVNREEAEHVRRRLLRRGILDKSRRLIRRGDLVEIPVSGRGGKYEYVTQSDPAYYRSRLSFEAVKRSLEEELEEDLACLRGRWELIGMVLILKVDGGASAEKKRIIARRFLDFMPRVKAVLNQKGIENPYREPRIEVLAGEATETVHKENGCRFKIDPARVMFSPGNLEERRRMARISSPRESVLDMFAGIGQFTVPMAKHSKPKRIYAVEKNPVAYGYLVENLKLNGLQGVTPTLGDCREKSPEGEVDRVLMGYFFHTAEFLSTALAAIDGGGTVHLHELVERRRLVERAEEVRTWVQDRDYEVKCIEPRVVKSYSPKLNHAVFDIVVR